MNDPMKDPNSQEAGTVGPEGQPEPLQTDNGLHDGDQLDDQEQVLVTDEDEF